MRKSKTKRRVGKATRATKKAAVRAKTRKQPAVKYKKTTARRKARKSYDSQTGRLTGRAATAQTRLDELTREYVASGMDEVAARDRARAELRDNPRGDWRHG
jgi:hypothetical protein